MIEQAREPPEFVSVLGGKLATRQGTRAHWSAENTAMHLVRSLQGLIFIDELDLVRHFTLLFVPVAHAYMFHRESRTFALVTATASPYWTRSMYGMDADRPYPSNAPLWNTHKRSRPLWNTLSS